MATERNADKVFVALPETYEVGLSVLSWVLSYFPQDRTKIIITHVITSPFKGLFVPGQWIAERDKMDLILNKYLAYCEIYKFRAEKLVHIADDIGEGLVQIIVKYGTKNLVMRSAANSDMTDLASETASRVMQEANLSCKLWFVSDRNLICTREVNSDNLKPAPKSEERSHWNARSTEASSSTSARSNHESTEEERKVEEDAIHEAVIEADNFEKMAEEIFGAHKKIANLVMKLAKKLERKEQENRELKETSQREKQENRELKETLQREKQENRELKETLQREKQENRELKETLQKEKQENDQLRREIDEKENEHQKLLSEEIEKVKIENDLHRSQRDEYFNQIQVANERKIALERQISDSQIVIKDLKLISALARDRIESLQSDLYNLQQERDKLVREVEELRTQIEYTHSSSSTALNCEFSFQELEQATQNFSESLKIGEGGFGPVYKGSLRQTTVAIKLLHSQSLQGLSQFQQEITILTKVRHPNLVTLIGACSEKSALVYEYLSNGSLEDRLTRANSSPPLTWQTRTRIIGEICLALIFLHSNKPQLVVHGDLKPDNILLDTNLVSKLGDFGISRLLKQPDSNTTVFFQTSHPAGTFAYIDPEFMSTGVLTPKSDIYSFGIIILRLLTGRHPVNIARQVEDAMRNGILLSVIDESAGTWPFEQAKELAKIALRCVELSRRQRPDLVNEVWAVVEPLMKSASTYVGPQNGWSDLGEESIPSHFICPIYQEVMQDPYIAADGFTYEKHAIREWLRGGHNTSPMTNLALMHQNLTPNRALRSAIQEWLQKHPQS